MTEQKTIQELAANVRAEIIKAAASIGDPDGCREFFKALGFEVSLESLAKNPRHPAYAIFAALREQEVQ